MLVAEIIQPNSIDDQDPILPYKRQMKEMPKVQVNCCESLHI